MTTNNNIPIQKPFDLQLKEGRVADFYVKLAQIAHAASLGRYNITEFGGVGQEPQFHEDLGMDSIPQVQTIIFKDLVIAARPIVQDMLRETEFVKGKAEASRSEKRDFFHE